MHTTAACLAPSTRTGMAANTDDQPTPEDQQAWHDFVYALDIYEWIRKTFETQWKREVKPGGKADATINTAWLKLVNATGYRRHKGAITAFAASVIGTARRKDNARERRWCRRMVRLDNACMDRSLGSPWKTDQDEEARVVQQQTRSDVREALPFLTGKPRQWAEMFLCICEEQDSPVDRHDPHRPDPFRATEERLGWTRYACDQVRAQLVRDHHLGRLAAMRPRP